MNVKFKKRLMCLHITGKPSSRKAHDSSWSTDHHLLGSENHEVWQTFTTFFHNISIFIPVYPEHAAVPPPQWQ